MLNDLKSLDLDLNMISEQLAFQGYANYVVSIFIRQVTSIWMTPVSRREVVIMSRASPFSSYNYPPWCPDCFYLHLYSLGGWLKSTETYLTKKTIFGSFRTVARVLIMSRAPFYHDPKSSLNWNLSHMILCLYPQTWRTNSIWG